MRCNTPINKLKLQTVGFTLFLLVFYLLLSASLYKIFQKAGVDPKKALIPGVNFMEWAKLIGRKSWWAALLLIPIVNFFIFAGMCVDLVRSFGKLGFGDSFMAVVLAPVKFFLVGNNDKDKYLGPTLVAESAYNQKIRAAQESGEKYKLKKLLDNNPYKKSSVREWAEAIIFAVFAAAFIRMFLIEAYKIPTSSMEGSLKVGDFLFVSKAHYGIRMPQTIFMVPLLHNRLPFINAESYFSKPSLNYSRLPALESIDKNEPIVFNYPAGGKIYLANGRAYNYDHMKMIGGLPPRFNESNIIERPVDKKDHYIKRCIGTPGDSLQIIDRQVYIDGVAAKNPSNMQFLYRISGVTGGINVKKLDEMGVSIRESNPTEGLFFLNKQQVEQIKGWSPNIKIDVIPNGDVSGRGRHAKHVFPHDPDNFGGWTVDNFGPIWIPKAGATVQINPQNIAPYKEIISEYEGNTLEIKGGQININGKPATSYTFKQDYYWAMGDNRHNSEDSRIWGYVPHDHIVGKPLFIWFSTKDGSIANGINWSRLFTSAYKM